MAWTRVPLSGGVYAWDGLEPFPEPSDDELKQYGLDTGKRSRGRAPCGTMAACASHRRHGERPCALCLEAERRYYWSRRSAKRAAERGAA